MQAKLKAVNLIPPFRLWGFALKSGRKTGGMQLGMVFRAAPDLIDDARLMRLVATGGIEPPTLGL